MTEQIEPYYFSIQTTAEKNYVGKISDPISFGIIISLGKANKIVVKEFRQEKKFILLEDALVIVPVRTAGGQVESLPVRFEELPTGSNSILINSDLITELNVIDPNAPIINVLKSVEANLIVSATEADVQNSSKIISKFGKR